MSAVVNPSHSATFLRETAGLAGKLCSTTTERMVHELWMLRSRGGRLFIAGLGGSAANASHAANDFRKLCGIEAYALNDNVAELTARANDEGWETIYAGAMQSSRPRDTDALLVLSVGGGADGVSMPLVRAIDFAICAGMRILGIVGRTGGHTAARGDCVVLIPTINEGRITPHAEAFQSVILHLLASHPVLQTARTKW